MTETRNENICKVHDASEADDPRVIAAVEEYMEAVESGRQPDRQDLLRRYADVAHALTECLDGLQFVCAVSPSLSATPGHKLVGPTSAEDGQPTTLGDFRLIREVGRGGMGIVYEAVQASLDRRVALKVLPFAAALDPKQLQRFKNEAQAAACLHHPNIVPVHAVGCERGGHYYAMQFIDGQSLASLIRELRHGGKPPDSPEQQAPDSATVSYGAHPPTRRPTGSPNRPAPEPGRELLQTPADSANTASIAALTTERSTRRSSYHRHAAALAKKAAEALEHAHQMGIVHRDVKPANLLLDGHGNLWITDFGLALIQQNANLTVTGEIVGTLRYMSPEQALAKHGLVDHRTDIYSLGVTLYELLTLEPACPGVDRQEVLQRIAFDEPQTPRRIDPAIPVELETIVLKAIAKGPTDRYATAQEFADDLQRFLDDSPVLARRPSLVERATRWARRHRPVVVSAAVLLLAATVGLSVTTVVVAGAYENERLAHDKESLAAQEAREQRHRAEMNLKQARRAVDLFYTLASEQAPAHLPPSDDIRRRLLEAALDYYHDLSEQYEDDPSAKAELAASRARVSKLLTELAALHGSVQLRILTERSVQEGLGLSPSQKNTVARLFEESRTAFRPMHAKLSPEARKALAQEVAHNTDKAVADLLTADQTRRFKQIALQVQQFGRHGFSDPEVVEALKLTTKQKDRIRKIQSEAYVTFWEAPHPERGSKWSPKKSGEFWSGVHQKVLDVLTVEQKERWRAMIGEPVRGEALAALSDSGDHRYMSSFPPGNRAGGGPGGRPPFGPGRPK